MDAARLRRAELLRLAGRPADDRPLDGGARAESEVQAALILRAEARAARHFLYLTASVPEDFDLRADPAPIAARRPCGVGAAAALELERDPLAVRRHLVLIQQHRSALVRHDDVERAAVGEIRDRDGA